MLYDYFYIWLSTDEVEFKTYTHIIIPQIRPINWLILFIYFNIALYICIVKLFYIRSLKLDAIEIKSNSETNKFMIII